MAADDPADGGAPGNGTPDASGGRGYGRSDLPMPRRGGAVRLDIIGRVLVRVLAFAVVAAALVVAVQWVAAGEMPSFPSLP